MVCGDLVAMSVIRVSQRRKIKKKDFIRGRAANLIGGMHWHFRRLKKVK
jgi:hypothetical protein